MATNEVVSEAKAELPIEVAPVSVSTPRIVTLTSGPVQQRAFGQVRYVADFYGRIIGVRTPNGSRVSRILSDGATISRKADDPRSWSDILKAEPIVLLQGRSNIVVIANETESARAFEFELECEEDASLAPAATAGSGAAAIAPRGAARSAAAARPSGGAPPPAVKRGASAPPMPGTVRRAASKPYATRKPSGMERSEDETSFLVLDRRLADDVVRLVSKRVPLGGSEIARVVTALDQARVRREVPNSRKGDVVVTMPYGLLVRLSAYVIRGVALAAGDTASVLAAFTSGLKLEMNATYGKAAVPAARPSTVALPDHFALTNGGVRCDVAVGPCACGATHDAEETLFRIFDFASTQSVIAGGGRERAEHDPDAGRTYETPEETQ